MALITIWGDESSQNAHRYMVLGTIWKHPACTAELADDAWKLKKELGFDKEFHWTEVRRHHLPIYRELIRTFKKYKDQGLLKYRCIVVDNSDPLHRIYSPDQELHFYKMYFWLIYNRLIAKNRYDIFLDRKRNKVPGRLSDLKDHLNRKFCAEHPTENNIVRRVEPRDGTQIELQMADVFTGAVAYERNGFYEKVDNPKNPKFQMVNMIQDILSIRLDVSQVKGQVKISTSGVLKGWDNKK